MVKWWIVDAVDVLTSKWTYHKFHWTMCMHFNEILEPDNAQMLNGFHVWMFHLIQPHYDSILWWYIRLVNSFEHWACNKYPLYGFIFTSKCSVTWFGEISKWSHIIKNSSCIEIDLNQFLSLFFPIYFFFFWLLLFSFPQNKLVHSFEITSKDRITWHWWYRPTNFCELSITIAA